MSLLRCLRNVNPNQLLGTKEIRNRILIISSITKDPHQLLKLDQNQFDQKRFKRFPTVKRRLTHKREWWAKKTVNSTKYDRLLTKDNQKFIKQSIEEKYSSPLINIEIESKEWTPDSKRTGLIVRKLGVLPAWLRTGEQITTTLLQVIDNHVINCFDVEETKNKTIYQNRWFTHDYATITVGAQSGDITRYTRAYAGLFAKAGVQPKQKISKFVITEDAMLPPGTPLYAQHFMIGQCCDLFGVSIDHGFEGVVKRWGFKGDGPKHQGATKFHRRPGSIGQSRKAGGPMKGRKMAGHMGCERVMMRSLVVMRINTKYNLIFLRGQSIPGNIGSWCYLFDAKCKGKVFRPDNPPPFPTFIPNNKEAVPENLYHPDLFVMDDESIDYPKLDEQKRRTGAKIARIRKK